MWSNIAFHALSLFLMIRLTFFGKRVLPRGRIMLECRPTEGRLMSPALELETMGAEVYQRLCRARAFIDHCYDHPLSLDQISSQACFSRYHFLRLFRQAFNKTPHQYLIERRIEKAKELLSAA